MQFSPHFQEEPRQAAAADASFHRSSSIDESPRNLAIDGGMDVDTPRPNQPTSQPSTDDALTDRAKLILNVASFLTRLGDRASDPAMSYWIGRLWQAVGTGEANDVYVLQNRICLFLGLYVEDLLH